MPLDVSYIRKVIARASYEDFELNTFGWKSHAHILQPLLSESELEIWEELIGIRLPEDYRSYITKLGNGGAGPAYGMSAFTVYSEQNYAEPTVFSDDMSELFHEKACEWYELQNGYDYTLYCEKTPEDQRLSFEEWDEELERKYEKAESFLFGRGQLFIANRGCDQDVYLLLNGSHCGYCHINSKEYDYSACGNGVLLPGKEDTDPQRIIAWEEYRKYLIPFAEYFNDYVKKCEEICNSLSAGQREQFHKERSVVRDFLEQLKQKDEEGMVKVLYQLEPENVSLKSRSLLTVRLQKHLHLPSPSMLRPGEKNIPDDTYQSTGHTEELISFYDKLLFEDSQRRRFRSRIALASESQNNNTYPHPSLKQLEDSFYRERIPNLE